MVGSGLEVLAQAQLLSNRFIGSVVLADGGRYLRQVVDSLRRNHAFACSHLIDRFTCFKPNHSGKFEPQSVNTTVSELAGDGCHDGEFFVRHIEHVTVASNLLANCTKRIFAASLLVLVEHDDVCHIQHLDFLKLGMCSELSGHDVERTVGHRGNRIATLTDSTRFTKNHVKTNRFGNFDGSVKVGTDFRPRPSTG